jgi:hypothetical protein
MGKPIREWKYIVFYVSIENHKCIADTYHPAAWQDVGIGCYIIDTYNRDVYYSRNVDFRFMMWITARLNDFAAEFRNTKLTNS